MSICLEILPTARSIEMFGSVHTSTAYSLSGNVLITINSTSSLLTGTMIRPPSLRLTSLSIVFEGKSESLSPLLGYNGARLCRVEKTLVGRGIEGVAAPMTLNCTGGDSTENQWQWTALFDLSIPGWLPPSVQVAELTETAYSLHAFAHLEPLEPPIPPVYSPTLPYLHRSPSSFSSFSYQLRKAKSTGWSIPYLPTLFSTPFWRQKERHITADPVDITILRLRTPPHTYLASPSLFLSTNQTVSPYVNVSPTDSSLSSPSGIPLSLLGALEVTAEVPDFTSLHEGSVPLALRLRTLPKILKGQQLRLVEFEVNIEQVEMYRARPDTRFAAAFPIPVPLPTPRREDERMNSTHTNNTQPTGPGNRDDAGMGMTAAEVPLLRPSYLAKLAHAGLVPFAGSGRARKAGIVKMAQRHELVPDGKVFYRPSGSSARRGRGVALDHRWARMDVSVPVLRSYSSLSSGYPDDHDEKEEDGKSRDELQPAQVTDRERRRKLVLPESRSPFARIEHEMHILLKVAWNPSEDPSKGVDRGISDIENGERVESLQCTIPLRFTRVPQVFTPRSTSRASGRTSAPISSPSPICAPVTIDNLLPLSPGQLFSAPAFSLPSLASLSSLFTSPPSPTTSCSSLVSPSSSSSSPPSSPSTTSLSLPLTPSPSSPVFGAHSALAMPTLPAYSQLFHENGERREDDDNDMLMLYGFDSNERGLMNHWLPPYSPAPTTGDEKVVGEGFGADAIGIAI